MANVVKMTIQFRRDTAANWELFKEVIPVISPKFKEDNFHTFTLH